VRTALLAGALAVAALLPAPASPQAMRQLFLGGQAFQLEVAADPASRERGLMGRTAIAPRGGMLFVFPDDAPRVFWMRNCLVDIDLLFVDRSGRIVSVHPMRAEPPRRPLETEAQYLSRLRHYPSGGPVRFAIELRAGAAAALGLVVGGAVDVTGIALPVR
jgi:hypothetical protein